MKLEEALKKVKLPPEYDPSTYVYDLDPFIEDLGIGAWGAYPESEHEHRFIEIPLQCWTCTDTVVGTKAYFLDEKLVAVTFQSGRKNDIKLYWRSPDSLEKVRSFILDHCMKTIQNRAWFLTKKELQTELKGYKTDL